MESGMESARICNFFKCTEEEITKMYSDTDLTTDILLKWCKLLEVDFLGFTVSILFFTLRLLRKSENQK
jgi:hypothetical protein